MTDCTCPFHTPPPGVREIAFNFYRQGRELVFSVDDLESPVRIRGRFAETFGWVPDPWSEMSAFELRDELCALLRFADAKEAERLLDDAFG